MPNQGPQHRAAGDAERRARNAIPPERPGTYRSNAPDPDTWRHTLTDQPPEPARTVPAGRTYRSRGRAGRLGRYLGGNRPGVVSAVAAAIALGYAATIAWALIRWTPSTSAALVLAGTGCALVLILLGVVLWARRD